MQTFVPAFVALSAAAVPLTDSVPGLAATTVAEALTELAARPSGGGSSVGADAAAVALTPVPRLDGETVQAAIQTLAANRMSVPDSYYYLADYYSPPDADVVLAVSVAGGVPPQPVIIPAGATLDAAVAAFNAAFGEALAEPHGEKLSFRGFTELDFAPSSREALDALGIHDTPHLVPGERVTDTRADAVSVGIMPGLNAAFTVDDAIRQLAARPALQGGKFNPVLRASNFMVPGQAGPAGQTLTVHYPAGGANFQAYSLTIGDLDQLTSLQALVAAINAAQISNDDGSPVYRGAAGVAKAAQGGLRFTIAMTEDSGVTVSASDQSVLDWIGLFAGDVAVQAGSGAPYTLDAAAVAFQGQPASDAIADVLGRLIRIEADFAAYRDAHP